jgi:hypothetical protein
MGRGGVHTGFWWGSLRERHHLEDPGVDVMIILKLIFRKYDGGMDWIDLAQNRDRWWALVNAVMETSGSINCGKFPDWPKTC